MDLPFKSICIVLTLSIIILLIGTTLWTVESQPGMPVVFFAGTGVLQTDLVTS